jgi:hypothetical protein
MTVPNEMTSASRSAGWLAVQGLAPIRSTLPARRRTSIVSQVIPLCFSVRRGPSLIQSLGNLSRKPLILRRFHRMIHQKEPTITNSLLISLLAGKFWGVRHGSWEGRKCSPGPLGSRVCSPWREGAISTARRSEAGHGTRRWRLAPPTIRRFPAGDGLSGQIPRRAGPRSQAWR